MSFTTPDMFPSMNSGLTLILIPRRSAHCHPQSGPFEMSNVKASLQNDRLVIREGRKKVVDTIVESGSSLCTSFDNDGESDWVGTEKNGRYTSHYGTAPGWVEMSNSLLSGPGDGSRRSQSTGPPPSSYASGGHYPKTSASSPSHPLPHSPAPAAPTRAPSHHAQHMESEEDKLAREEREDRPAIDAGLVPVPAGSPLERKLQKKHGIGNFTQFMIGTGVGKGVYSFDGSRFYVERNRKKGRFTWSCFS